MKIFSFTTMNKVFIGLVSCIFLGITFHLYAATKITQKEIFQAQKTWGQGVVHIGKVYRQHGNYKKAAEQLVNQLYAYQLGPVLFKPTKATKQPFRLTKEGAISYFVGGNKQFPEDKGFALEPWTHVRFHNAGVFIDGNYAVAMGTYYFTPLKGKPVKVEYTFGYIKDKKGHLKINLHHSSLPYSN